MLDDPQSSMSSANDTYRNRRSFPRRAGKARVEYRPGKYGMGKPVSGRLIDLSQDGAVFAIAQTANAGDEMELEIHSLVGNLKHRCRGSVIRCERETEDSDSEHLVFCQFEKRVPYALFVDLSR